MSNVEDIRKAVQDFLAPDLKAFAARLESLERKMKEGFEEAEKLNQERFSSVDQRFNAMEQLGTARHEAVMNAIAASHTSIMNSLEMERRLARIESQLQKPN